MAFMNYAQFAKGLVILHKRMPSENISVRVEINGRKFSQQAIAATTGLLVIVDDAAGLQMGVHGNWP